MPTDDAGFQAALDALLARVDAAAPAIALKAGLAIQAEGMALTHVQTGTLRRSWRTELAGGGDGVYAVRSGPTVIYGRRVELGYLPPLTDSLGRQFPHAVPHPYVRPAIESSLPRVGAVIRDGFAAVIGG